VQTFRFSLEKVLQFKTQRENEQSARLAQLQRELLNQRHRLAELLKEQQQVLAQWEQIQRGTLSPKIIALYQRHLEYLRRCSYDQRELIAFLDRELEEERRLLLRMSKERRVLERLKERQLEEYRSELMSKEQGFLDEVGNNLYVRNKSRGSLSM
jgi:flagellar FliJ protein